MFNGSRTCSCKMPILLPHYPKHLPAMNSRMLNLRNNCSYLVHRIMLPITNIDHVSVWCLPLSKWYVLSNAMHSLGSCLSTEKQWLGRKREQKSWCEYHSKYLTLHSKTSSLLYLSILFSKRSGVGIHFILISNNHTTCCVYSLKSIVTTCFN